MLEDKAFFSFLGKKKEGYSGTPLLKSNSYSVSSSKNRKVIDDSH